MAARKGNGRPPKEATGKPAMTDIAAKLWNLCTMLMKGGVTYHQYVTELTYLLFLKMLQETRQEDRLPKGLRWADLRAKEGVEQFTFYKQLLLDLGSKGSKRVRDIYADASTSIREPKTLAALLEAFDAMEWYSADRESFGDLYEGLLEKMASEGKKGAGQYFTPRPLVSTMVKLAQPKAGELVQDPAAGTGGFLIAADRFVKDATTDHFDLKEAQVEFQKQRAFYGMELVPDTRRLALMNLMLHDIDGDLQLGDALSQAGARLTKADVILTNPPFGTSGAGGKPTRDDFVYPTSNWQLAFVEHIYRGLKPGGRAAVVVPDNVLFADGMGQQIRADLMDTCDLHTILRLPTGIFYAQGVKTNVLFFTRGASDAGNTKTVWIYDARTNAPSFGKKTPLTEAYFDDFVKVFGEDPSGGSRRKDQGEEGRFRKFSREFIRERKDNLDISWLKDDGHTEADDLPEPEVVLAEIRAKLEGALKAVANLESFL